MFNFLKGMYELGRINSEQLKLYVPVCISQEQYNLIVGGAE